MSGQQVDALLEANVVTWDWRIDCTMNRAHSPLAWLTPVEFESLSPDQTPTGTLMTAGP